MASWRSFTVAAALLASPAWAALIGPVADLRISNKAVKPDGVDRLASVVNGRVDRTILRGKKGDTFQVNVINELNDPLEYEHTSIHWHGITQQGSAWADGASMVTQCPIVPGNSFLYTFKADVPGTYWYHSHLSTQYCDGVRGPLVVYDPADPHKKLYDVDDESTILTISDWYQIPFRTLLEKFPIDVPRSNATLFNGVGRSDADLTAPLAVIPVKKGKRYRFRILNMGCDPDFKFQIDGHTFTVIEVDGINHKPKEVDQLQIFPGQRYSIVLNANQPVGNYYIRADPNVAVTTGFANGLNSAILRYEGAPNAEPTTKLQTPVKPLKEWELKPLVGSQVPGEPRPGGATKVFNLQSSFNFTDFRFYMNGATFTAPNLPVLLQILSGASSAQSLLPSNSMYEINQGDTVEITLPGYGVAGPHPFHLHGHSFYVIRSAGSTEYNYVDPPLRDVVDTGVDGDNVTIRFQVDNPGPWFLHCHIDLHIDIGLGVIFAESVPEVNNSTIPAAWHELCPTYNRVDNAELKRREFSAPLQLAGRAERKYTPRAGRKYTRP